MVAALRRDTLYDLLAPPLILATAFVSFVNHNEYGYAAGEIWISFIGLAAAGLLCGLVMALDGQWLRILVTSGLLTLFVDLQFEWLDPPTYLRALSLGFGVVLLCWLLREHLSRITALVFATMLAADLLFPDGSGEWSANAPAPRVDAQTMAQPTPPVVVHLIFDEFIGVEGIPAEVPHGAAVARALRSFLHDAGFHVFARAYSRFDRTENSIPNMLNYASVAEQRHFNKHGRRQLSANQYFQDMRKRGYAIHVYQPDYLDFCAGHEGEISSCRTFPSAGIAALDILQLPALSKAELVIRNFFELSGVWRTLRHKTLINSDHLLEPPRSPLPACPGACARENGSESVSSPTRVGLRQQCARRGEPGQWAKSCGPRRPESKMCAVRHALSRPGRHSLLPWCVGPSQPKIHAPASQLRLLPRRGGGFPP
jgi:hypothetical protein